ncbi:sir2 family domain-containing protein [Phthorimaea operculella]|nr:sir2 family domain-containing protein [Phthorimaea operculella]
MSLTNVAREVEDSPEELREKCKILAKALRDAKHLVVYTGAGISTAADIPDYRGPRGVWTRLRRGETVGRVEVSGARPTLTHMALSALWARGTLKFVVSQNCDGLHVRAGLPRRALAELHGDMFAERCQACRRVYLRAFDTTERTARHAHRTRRLCHRCGAELSDTIVHFGERGRAAWPLNWAGALRHAAAADVVLCLGSSLKVLRRYPRLWRMQRAPAARPALYIVNLQWTPKDSVAALKINARTDQVMAQVARRLGLKVPRYDPRRDPLLAHAVPLAEPERHTTRRPLLDPPPTDAPADVDMYSDEESLSPSDSDDEVPLRRLAERMRGPDTPSPPTREPVSARLSPPQAKVSTLPDRLSPPHTQLSPHTIRQHESLPPPRDLVSARLSPPPDRLLPPSNRMFSPPTQPLPPHPQLSSATTRHHESLTSPRESLLARLPPPPAKMSPPQVPQSPPTTARLHAPLPPPGEALGSSLLPPPPDLLHAFQVNMRSGDATILLRAHHAPSVKPHPLPPARLSRSLPLPAPKTQVTSPPLVSAPDVIMTLATILKTPTSNAPAVLVVPSFPATSTSLNGAFCHKPSVSTPSLVSTVAPTSLNGPLHNILPVSSMPAPASLSVNVPVCHKPSISTPEAATASLNGPLHHTPPAGSSLFSVPASHNGPLCHIPSSPAPSSPRRPLSDLRMFRFARRPPPAPPPLTNGHAPLAPSSAPRLGFILPSRLHLPSPSFPSLQQPLANGHVKLESVKQEYEPKIKPDIDKSLSLSLPTARITDPMTKMDVDYEPKKEMIFDPERKANIVTKFKCEVKVENGGHSESDSSVEGGGEEASALAAAIIARAMLLCRAQLYPGLHTILAASPPPPRRPSPPPSPRVTRRRAAQPPPSPAPECAWCVRHYSTRRCQWYGAPPADPLASRVWRRVRGRRYLCACCPGGGASELCDDDGGGWYGKGYRKGRRRRR